MTSTEKSSDAKSASSSSNYSTKERNCKTVPEPPARLLDIGDLFSKPSDPNDKPNLERLKQHILLEGRLTEQAALRIIETGNYHIYLLH
jgi:serine/threonine-protein phosphatase 2B catalytic subunit